MAALTRLLPAVKGRLFEETCAQWLHCIRGVQCFVYGSSVDRGVDIHGSWALPDETPPLKLVAQCKALAAACGSNPIQSFDSVLTRMGAREPVLGVFFSAKGLVDDRLSACQTHLPRFSARAVEESATSANSLVLCHLDESGGLHSFVYERLMLDRCF
jgi:hypothetical protein